MANADPSADYPAAALALRDDSSPIVARSPRDSFFTAMFRPRFESDEIILAVRFPIPDAAGYANSKARHRVSHWLAPSSRASGARCASRLPGPGPWFFDPRISRMR